MLVALAGVALTAHRQPGEPPLYDGCVASVYRELGAHPAPASAHQRFARTASSPPFALSTADAQATVEAPQGLLTSPSTAFTVGIVPVAPPTAAPHGGAFDGNVYRIDAVATDGRVLEPQPDTPGATIILRATSSGGQMRAIYALGNGSWRPLSTASVGCADGYVAQTQRLGYFALVVPVNAAATARGVPAWLVALMSAAVLAAVAVLLLRLSGVQLARR